MKKIMSCFLVLCLVTVATNVAFASNSYKGKVFVIEKSDVSKIEVLNANDVNFELNAYLETGILFVSDSTIKAFVKESVVNLFIAPDQLRMRDRRFSHSTAYLLNLPKNDLLPRNHTWRYGSSMRC